MDLFYPATPSPFCRFFGGHFYDSLSVGQCKCKEFARFTFDDDLLREGLTVVGSAFGIEPCDL